MYADTQPLSIAHHIPEILLIYNFVALWVCACGPDQNYLKIQDQLVVFTAVYAHAKNNFPQFVFVIWEFKEHCSLTYHNHLEGCLDTPYHLNFKKQNYFLDSKDV